MSGLLRIAVCESSPEMLPGSEEWQALAGRSRAGGPDLFLLNEMPFGRWLAAGREPDAAQIEESLVLHDRGIALLHELGARCVLGTRPARRQERLVNEAFVWTPEEGATGVHTKQYFPDEEGYYEARWFQPGERHFRVVQAAGIGAGFLVCTELMFNEHARRYGREHAHLLAVPRAVGRGSLGRWLAALKMAAIVSGCYAVSSNRGGLDSRGQQFGGCGWVVDPEGDLVAQTSRSTPVVFHDLDPSWAERARTEYPCYVRELK